MSIPLGRRLSIRSSIHVAAEPIPYFWPMRTFIHHNPLHGLEHLPFEEALKLGAELFHGRTFLQRPVYQEYLKQGKVERETLNIGISKFLADKPAIADLDLTHLINTLMSERGEKLIKPCSIATPSNVYAALHGEDSKVDHETIINTARNELEDELLGDHPLYEAVDSLYGTHIGVDLDELVTKVCLDFFDEGQSVWDLPNREKGLFNAWRDQAKRNLPFFMRGLHVADILDQDSSPEGVIAYVLDELGIPQDLWINYLTKEMTRLHGWAGFIRWRFSAKTYHWQQAYPADMVDFVAIRMTLGLAMMREASQKGFATTTRLIRDAIQQRSQEMYLRYELNGKRVAPELAHSIDMALMRGKTHLIEKAFNEYVQQKLQSEADSQANRLKELFALSDQEDALLALTPDELTALLQLLKAFEAHEGMIWLRSLEMHAVEDFLAGINLQPSSPDKKRPFAQAMFCIDTRSERIRRHLEKVGDYQTFGIAGFFGVPVSYMELGKGSEMHLCPVILTPKNLVPEITAITELDEPAIEVLTHVMHDLKESTLTPFVTVEAIGLLFGFDMIGKTIAPRAYHKLRKLIEPEKRVGRLLVDKLSRDQADSIVRAVQRVVIMNAVEHELTIPRERITDALVRELREASLGHDPLSDDAHRELHLDEYGASQFIQRLNQTYKISTSDAHQQLERLGRIGFTIDEQVNYVSTALHAIGMTKQFSRFVLVCGHGSVSDNNPYESALDCGACGGNHGLISAKVLAQMANKPHVRRALSRNGIDIPDDTWFMPAMHNTTTDEITLHNIDLVPPSHLVYLDRLQSGLTSATRLCAAERMPTLELDPTSLTDPTRAAKIAHRNSMDWSQVRPEWGLSKNVYFVIGRRELTQHASLQGRAFLHSYDYCVDPKRRLLDTILTGPLVVGQWINMEHYFSVVDNDRFGSGSKVNHNVACRLGVMTGNLSDLRTGLPSQTVLKDGKPFHEPLRLITVIEAPFEMAKQAIEGVVAIKQLVKNAWIRMMVIDPETQQIWLYSRGEWIEKTIPTNEERRAS